MEAMKELATAYYEKASEAEKELAREFFKKLDQNGDGKVSLIELKESKSSSEILYDNVFEKLDSNSDGFLDFDEVLVIYMAKKLGNWYCSGCSNILLVGSFFSCFLCLSKYPNTVDLCCDCYRKGEFKHEHSTSNFLDSQSLAIRFMKHMADEEKTRWKREMEGFKKQAMAYYRRASEEEMDSALEFFKRMDCNGDGKVSILEFKNSEMSSWSRDKKVFEKLDQNGDGILDFEEVLALHYIENKVSIPKCDGHGCRDLLVGPYFSCGLCLGKGSTTYDLCSDCYGDGNFEHEHSSNFLDHHYMLMLFRHHLMEKPKTSAKKEMEELREIAKAHYHASSGEVQALAHEFFNAMDSDGDGQIELPEFLSFMRQQGHYQMQNPYFFKELDRNGTGTLDFWEVMTLYYIIKSGRPFCSSCGIFIPGIFFSCVECYRSPQSSFTLCRDCYCSGKCNHNHNGRTQFLDNYTLLQAKRDSSQAARINHYKPTYNTYVVHHTPPVPNLSTAIVPAYQVDKWNVALKAFEAAMAVGNISGTLCTIL